MEDAPPICPRGSTVYAPTPPTPAMDARISLKVGGAADLALQVLRSLQVGALKLGIEQATGVKASAQLLTYEGEELQDEYALWAYHIIDGDSVFLDCPIGIRVDGRSRINLQMLRSASIAALKSGIEQLTGTPPSRQILRYGGHVLSNDSILWDLGLPEGAALDLDELIRLRVVGIVKFAAMFVEIWTSNTIGCLKKTIKDETGIPIANQRLYKDPHSLCNSHSLREVDLLDGDVVRLERNVLIPETETVNVVYYLDTQNRESST